MQISYEHFYFQATNRPQYSFKRIHQGFKHVRSAYASHVSRPQPHGLNTASTRLPMMLGPAWTLLDLQKGSEGSEGSRGGAGGVQRVHPEGSGVPGKKILL